MSFNIDGESLNIEYPCLWDYKVIGEDETLIRKAISEVIQDLEHTIEHSRESREGKYISLSLAVTVTSEDHRNHIFIALKDHPDIKMVL